MEDASTLARVASFFLRRSRQRDLRIQPEGALTEQAARLFFDELLTFTTYHPNLDARILAVLAVGLASHYVPERWYENARSRFVALPALGQGAALFVAALGVRAMASAEAVPFVYFQF